MPESFPCSSGRRKNITSRFPAVPIKPTCSPDADSFPFALRVCKFPQSVKLLGQYRTKSVWRLCTPSACKFPVIFHKNAREYIKYSLRFLFHLTENLTTHLSHNLCAVLPYKKSRLCGQRLLLRNDFSYFFLFFVSCRSSCIRSARQVTARITAPPTTIQPTTTFRIW